MRVVITGAAGNLGSVVWAVLAEAGMEVVATDRKPLVVDESGVAPADQSTADGRSEPPIRPGALHLLDLRDPDPWPNFLAGAHAVVHCGAEPRDPAVPKDALFASNVKGTLNLCQAALSTGVERFVYVSTVQVFSSEGVPEDRPTEIPYLPMDGGFCQNPQNPYAVSKAVGEVLVQSILSPEGVKCQSLRFPWLVHPTRTGSWGRQLRPLRKREIRAVVEQGFACLSFRDAARLILACLRSDLPGYRTYYPALSVVSKEMICRYVDRYYAGVPLRRPVTEMTSLVDLSEITAETGWVPRDIPRVESTRRLRRFLGRIARRLR
ncbi:MAG: NAD(P)-dependent oxidoreductase [Gemmatimonadota bacterium]